MAYYYKITDENVATPPLEGIEVHEENSANCSGPSIKYDFSKHVLIELLDGVTPESKLWIELGIAHNKNITHKRMIADPHRVNCRRAVVVCSSPDEAKKLAQKLSQLQIMRRSICAVVIQELLSDICLFEQQIIQFGDKRSQHQLVYVTELTRRREVSGLAQYLREKFSPFGTILSVLVSADKDGYAYPEGVVRFAYLSEAFAAELAYDQCAVALERLSVTTHHNILLAQCDLRARLREAYSRHSSEFSFNISPESQMKDNSDQTKILPSINSKSSVKESDPNESHLNLSDSTINGNEFPSDSAELADVLRKPCESNLVDCLQGIAASSDDTFSRRDSAYSHSLAETEPVDARQSGVSSSADNSFSPSMNKTWSSRIMGWITDLPVADPSSDGDATTNNISETVHNILESTALIETDKSFECDQQLKQPNHADVVSSTNSFVTCKNDDINSSFHSIPSSPGYVSDSNNVTMVQAETLSHSSTGHANETLGDENLNMSGSSMSESTPFKPNGSPVSSLKRKNSSMMTEKLSLKSKKIDSSVNEALDNERTVNLPSVPETKTCSVVLNTVPELDEYAKNLSERIPVVVLERLSMSQPVDRSLKIDQDNNINGKKAKGKKHSKKTISSCSSSVKSQSIRRSSRLTSQEKKFADSLISSMANGAKSSSSSANFEDQNEKVSEGTESPLRMWLRKELDISTNNQVSRTQESTKSIVCAATNKDVLISVGCSHMTCDFCYPDSTKLLLGFV